MKQMKAEVGDLKPLDKGSEDDKPAVDNTDQKPSYSELAMI